MQVAAAAATAAARDLSVAERHFCRALCTAAELAGARRKLLGRKVRAGRGEHDAPFYDAECQAAKGQLRSLLRSRPHRDAHCSRAENQYHSLVRRKKRSCKIQRLGRPTCAYSQLGPSAQAASYRQLRSPLPT